MKKVYYYIGSNNETHKLEKTKIEQILATHFEEFTAFEILDYWKGLKEKTLKIKAITELADSQLASIDKELKIKLKQENVLMDIVHSNCAFIQ